jgi:hypothetical protein
MNVATPPKVPERSIAGRNVDGCDDKTYLGS